LTGARGGGGGVRRGTSASTLLVRVVRRVLRRPARRERGGGGLDRLLVAGLFCVLAPMRSDGRVECAGRALGGGRDANACGKIF
jgi:hypothetical protein